MMKLLKTALLAVALGTAGVSLASAQQVRLGVAPEPYPPFASMDASGEWVAGRSS